MVAVAAVTFLLSTLENDKVTEATEAIDVTPVDTAVAHLLIKPVEAAVKAGSPHPTLYP
jgi:uncharacterized cupredoxin-like copper-binding protein